MRISRFMAARLDGNDRFRVAVFAVWAAAVLCLPGCGGDAAPVPSEVTVDLFEQFDVANNVNRGNATLGQNGLQFTAVRGACQAYFPQFAPPEQYDLQVDVVRHAKSGAVVIGLYAWGQQCRVVIDQPTESGPVTGLAPLEGKWPGDEGYPDPLSGGLLSAGEPATILCQVRRDRLAVQCNGVVIINLDRKATMLGKLPHFEIPNEKALSVGTWHGKATVQQMQVRCLPAE